MAGFGPVSHGLWLTAEIAFSCLKPLFVESQIDEILSFMVLSEFCRLETIAVLGLICFLFCFLKVATFFWFDLRHLCMQRGVRLSLAASDVGVPLAVLFHRVWRAGNQVVVACRLPVVFFGAAVGGLTRA